MMKDDMERKGKFLDVLASQNLKIKEISDFVDENLYVLFGFFVSDFVESANNGLDLSKHLKVITQLYESGDSEFNNMLKIDLFISIHTEIDHPEAVYHSFSNTMLKTYEQTINQWKAQNS